jgi:hypothetical protein
MPDSTPTQVAWIGRGEWSEMRRERKGECQ